MEENRSEKFEKVKGYYKSGMWSFQMVRNAVGKWITKEEFQEITGKTY